MVNRDDLVEMAETGKPGEISDDVLDTVVGGLKKAGGGDDLDDLQVERNRGR